MDKKPNIIFCGSRDELNNKSWGKTNNCFIDSLSHHANLIGFIDYNFQNRYLRKIHAYYSKIYYGEHGVRDPFFDFFAERSFIKQFKQISAPPDLVFHLSGVCIPEGYNEKCSHILYTDASIMGPIRYNNYKPGKRYMTDFLNESKKYCDRVKYIFTLNEWTSQSLIDDFAIESKKVINIGFGANLKPYFGVKDYTNNQLLIVLRRGLEKNKGLFLLLEAFKIAKSQNPSIKLAVVGTTLQPIEGVTYYEGYPREKTIELFNQASLFTMPALFEPNGMVYIEALACKTPILGLNRLAFPEFCGYGKYGFIVKDNIENIAHTILSAISDPQKLKEMGETGQEYVTARFDWDVVVKKIIDKCLN